MKILCLLNPLAADGLAIQRWPAVAALIKSFHAEVDLLADRNATIEQQVMAHARAHPLTAYAAIAGIGGDGTHSAALNALMALSREYPGVEFPPYAFIPMGTGNDMAKYFGLTNREDVFVSDLRRAVSTILHGADYRMDLGLYNGRYFGDALTVGVDSRILQQRNRRRARLQRIPVLRRIIRGRLLYSLVLAPCILSANPVQAEVFVDGGLWYSGPIINLIIKNTRVYAADFEFCPSTYANDGLLDLLLFNGQKDYLTTYFLAMRAHPRSLRAAALRLLTQTTHIQGRHFLIRLARDEAAQLDGEELPPAREFEVSVVPHAVRIRTPAEP
jgi:diacylglycerol kinase family enzyme